MLLGPDMARSSRSPWALHKKCVSIGRPSKPLDVAAGNVFLAWGSGPASFNSSVKKRKEVRNWRLSVCLLLRRSEMRAKKVKDGRVRC